MAEENTFGFSTKRVNPITGFALYEARPYNPSLGSEWVAKLVVEAAHLFEPSAGGGATGSLPGTSGAGPIKNPFKRGPEWNITEQMKVIKRDPKLAERLKAAA